MSETTVPSLKLYAVAHRVAGAVRWGGVDQGVLADYVAARLERYGQTLDDRKLEALGRIIARNHAANLLRRERRARLIERDRASVGSAAETNTEHLVVIGRALTAATAQLSDDDRALLRMVHVDGLGIWRAAGVLGLTSKDTYRRFRQINTNVARRMIELAQHDESLRNVLENLHVT